MKTSTPSGAAAPKDEHREPQGHGVPGSDAEATRPTGGKANTNEKPGVGKMKLPTPAEVFADPSVGTRPPRDLKEATEGNPAPARATPETNALPCEDGDPILHDRSMEAYAGWEAGALSPERTQECLDRLEAKTRHARDANLGFRQYKFLALATDVNSDMQRVPGIEAISDNLAVHRALVELLEQELRASRRMARSSTINIL